MDILPSSGGVLLLNRKRKPSLCGRDPQQRELCDVSLNEEELKNLLLFLYKHRRAFLEAVVERVHV